jgi:hypothetical protein
MNWKNLSPNDPPRCTYIQNLVDALLEYARVTNAAVSDSETKRQALEFEESAFKSSESEEKYVQIMTANIQNTQNKIRAHQIRTSTLSQQLLSTQTLNSSMAFTNSTLPTDSQLAIPMVKTTGTTGTSGTAVQSLVATLTPNSVPTSTPPLTKSSVTSRLGTVPQVAIASQNEVQVIKPNVSSSSSTTTAVTTAATSMHSVSSVTEVKKELLTPAMREDLEKKLFAKWMQLQLYIQPLFLSLSRIDKKDKTKLEEYRKRLTIYQLLNTHPNQLIKSDVQTNFQSLLSAEQYLRSLDLSPFQPKQNINKAIESFFEVLKVESLESVNTKLLSNCLRNLNRGTLDNTTILQISKYLDDNSITPENLFWWESSLNLKKTHIAGSLESGDCAIVSIESGRSHSHESVFKHHKSHHFFSASPLFEAMRERIAKWCEDDLFFKPLVIIDENTLMIEEFGYKSTKLYITFTRNLPDLFAADPQKAYFSPLIPNFTIDRTLFPFSFQRLVAEHRTKAAPYIVLEDFLTAYKNFLVRCYVLEDELLPYINSGVIIEEVVQGGNVFLKCVHGNRKDHPPLLIFVPREYPTSGPLCQLLFASGSETTQFHSAFYSQCCERQNELLSKYTIPIVHSLKVKDVIQIWLSLSSTLSPNIAQ